MRPILEVDSVVSIQRSLGYSEELEGERREKEYMSIFLFGAHRRIPMGAESAMQLSTGLARLVRQLHGFFSPRVSLNMGRDCIYFQRCVCFSLESAFKWCFG